MAADEPQYRNRLSRGAVMGLMAYGLFLSAWAQRAYCQISADSKTTVVLKDGTQLSGFIGLVDQKITLLHAPDSEVDAQLIEPQLVARILSPQDVKSKDALALASLRRASDAYTDTQTGITRYEAFLRQFPDSPSAREAQADLLVWKTRQSTGMFRQGAFWVTPQEAQRAKSRAEELASAALELLQLGSAQDAEKTIEQGLRLYPDASGLLYLKAHVAWQMGQIAEARAALDAAVRFAPDHAPSKNNLAAVLFRQTATTACLVQLETALRLMPQNETILNNAAEMLNTLSVAQAQSPAGQKLRATFEQFDAAYSATLVLPATMPAAGAMQPVSTQPVALRVRWGGAYIPATRKAEIDAEITRLSVERRALDDRIAQAESRVGQIDRQTADNLAEMRRLEARSYYRTSDGTLVRAALPRVYNDLLLDNERMAAERRTVLADRAAMIARRDLVDRDLPRPIYTGQLQFLGPEHLPAWVPADLAAASTQPATPATQPSLP